MSNKSSWRLVTELLSAFAVVLSLVFVGLEVRESARQTALNTQSVQVSAYQELIGRIAEINMLNLERPNLDQLFLSEAEMADLSPAERGQVENLVLIRLRYGDLAYYQHELGMLSEERFESAMGPLGGIICSPLFVSAWEKFGHNFITGYRDYVDNRVAARDDC